jgi:hypothetical protein
MNRLRLAARPLAFCMLDATITLIGQPEAYWAGDLLAAREANPLGRWLLHLDPLAFIAGVVGSLAVYALLLTRLPANLARVAAFAILFLHAVGASTWLLHWGISGYIAAVLLLLAGSRVLAHAWQMPECRPSHVP